MMLQADDFASFFRAVHGHAPFPWQRRLVEQLAGEDCWPDVLDLPTGAGKTAALDAAVFHLALRADEPRRAALRIVLVVDRRLVVDDAHRRAEEIAAALRAPDRPVVEEVRRRLLQLAGAGGPPLAVARLRGGAPFEYDWARTPTQPTILCSTVDQVGSRLLFRGYGVSSRMRPVHAGLLGEGTLILLDEAHLSEPFRQTLDNVRTIGRAQVRVVVLTATPGERAERPLRLQPEDYRNPTLRGRVEAAKPVRLIKPIRSGDPATAFARVARRMAERLRRGGVAAPAVGVVVNRVDLARAVFEKLDESEPSCLLMIGRTRTVDRERIVAGPLEPFRTGAPGRAQAGPLMVVATQCLEVGVDLDLDGLVTQAASLDALRQRFGRLNRAGRDIAAEGAILITAESLAKRTDDPVYGDRIRKTWDALTGIAGKAHVDFGIQALDQSLQTADLSVDELAAERFRAPVLMPAYLDLWSQTSPPPVADPEVGLFLHGAQRSQAEVSIVWRDDITAADLAADVTANLAEILELVPPRAAEMVAVPIWAAAAWLARWGTARAARVADVPEREDEIEIEQGASERMAFRWAGTDDRRTGLVGHAQLQPGDVLVVPADYGGCDTFGWAPQSREHVRDVADEAAWAYRGRRHAVRITPEVEHGDRLAAVLSSDDLDLDALIEALPAEGGDDTPEARPKRSVRRQLAALQSARGGVSRIILHRPYGQSNRGVILVVPQGVAGAARGAQAITEDDVLSRTANRPVPLGDHTGGVVKFVERFAATLRLDAPIAGDLRLAAVLHDVGKADERFQILLAGGDWWNRPEWPVLAKSGRLTSRAAWDRAGLPKGWRHEALSVLRASADPRFGEAHDPFLVLWLIGVHHGFGRPFFGFSDPQAEGTGPQSLAYSFRGLDWASVFGKLRQRYGVWGLARLEAILRLADHRAAEAEEEDTSPWAR